VLVFGTAKVLSSWWW